MDITTLRAADTAAIHLKNPAGGYMMDGDAPVRIIIYGPGSKAAASLGARQSDRAVKRLQDNDMKVVLLPYEQRMAEEAEDLAAITVGFENLDYPPAGDKQGAELFEAVYADPALGFIKAQIAKASADWGNFTGASATS